MASRTVTQRSNADGFPKAGELIEMTGLENLEASQRAISNLLYQHAHDSGSIAEPGAEFEIPMATIRSAVSKHESGDRLRQSLLAIAGVRGMVSFTTDPKSGERGIETIRIAGLFEFFDVERQDMAAGAKLRYGLNRRLVAVINQSARWGRIKAEVFCAMRSRYAIALYEALALRRNMDRCIETFPIDRFRELLAVKADTYKIGTDFQRFVIDPAVLEVNGLSDMGVKIEVQRKHGRAPIHGVTMAWWKKSVSDLAAAVRERNRSKIGRMARLKGSVETATPHIALALPKQA
jgi:Initiator Replication protein